MKITFRLLCCSLLFLCAGYSSSYGQKTAIYDQPDMEFREAQDLYSKEKFVAAQEKFLNVLRSGKGSFTQLSAQSAYYAAMCALNQFNNDAEYLVVEYVRAYPEDIRVNSAWMELARYHFRFKHYKDALAAFEKVDKRRLDKAELDEFNFKAAYCYFMANKYEEAKAAFNEVGEGKYLAAATYYFAHISYEEKNYETALKSFRKILTDEVYGKFAPYYMTQIYYVQEKYNDLLAFAPSLLDSASSKRAPEIARMIGSSYYKTKKYREAIPYLQLYFDKSETYPTLDDYFELGFCYFQIQDYEQADKWLSRVRQEDADLMTQITLYYLGICKMNSASQKMDALHYFQSAYKMGIDPAITENSLFNFAKLGYETGYNAYNETIESFQKHINEYPSSGHVDEAWEYLSDLYLSTKNYKDALLSIEQIKIKDKRLNTAYQKVCLYRGMELFNNSLFDDAIRHFNKSVSTPVDPALTSLAEYWKGESYYRKQEWDSALISFRHFGVITGASELPEFNMASYNAGYCFFKKQQYDAALIAFKNFLGAVKNENARIVNDAKLRTADCYFMRKEYNSAVEYYDQSMAMKLADQDYALYQKALAYGPLGKLDQKATMLNDLVKRYPRSDYRDDALFEAGKTWQNIGNDRKAVDAFDQLIKECPQSAYISQAMLKKGLLYYNMKDAENAIRELKLVVANYRGTPEAKQALMTLERIHLDLDRVPDYVAYLATLGESISNDLQDSLTYIAVENKYMENDCENAVKGFASYIKAYPQGQFIIDANFYKAECDLQLNNVDAALESYLFVISQSQTKYSETALAKASAILLDKKEYAQALPLFKVLKDVSQQKQNISDARVGIMHCYYNLDSLPQAVDAARVVLKQDKLPEELMLESHMVIARSALAMDSLALAMAEFNLVAKTNKSELAAEAKWNVGYIYFFVGDYETSEKTAYDLINQVPSYDYWVAKAHILLAENAYKLGNAEFAKQILESIINNYEGADLVEMAQKKKMEIMEAERQEELLRMQQNKPDDGQPNDVTPGSF